MPIVYDEQNEGQGQAGQNISGGSGVIGARGVSGGGQTQQQPNQPAKSGSWTNLRSYLDANRNAGRQMAEKVTGNVRQEGQEAQQALQGAQQQFQQSVMGSGVGYGEDTQQAIQQAVQDPTQAIQNQDLTDRIAKIREARYEGPTDLSQAQGYQNYLKEAGEAQQKVNKAGTMSGRNELLNKVYSQPEYTSGQRKLDQLLIQNTPESREQFASLKNILTQQDQSQQQAQEQARQLAEQRAQETQQAQEAFRQSFGITPEGTFAQEGAIPEFQQQLEQNLQQRKTQRQQEFEALQNRLRNRDITAQELGLSEGQRLYNALDKTDPFVQMEAFDPTKAVTQDEFSRAQALQQLAGIDAPISSAIGQEYVGGLQGPSINQEAIRRAVQESQGLYESGTPFNQFDPFQSAFNRGEASLLQNLNVGQIRQLLESGSIGLGGDRMIRLREPGIVAPSERERQQKTAELEARRKQELIQALNRYNTQSGYNNRI